MFDKLSTKNVSSLKKIYKKKLRAYDGKIRLKGSLVIYIGWKEKEVIQYTQIDKKDKTAIKF